MSAAAFKTQLISRSLLRPLRSGLMTFHSRQLSRMQAAPEYEDKAKRKQQSTVPLRYYRFPAALSQCRNQANLSAASGTCRRSASATQTRRLSWLPYVTIKRLKLRLFRHPQSKLPPSNSRRFRGSFSFFCDKLLPSPIPGDSSIHHVSVDKECVYSEIFT